MVPAILLHVYRMFSEPTHCPWLWLVFCSCSELRYTKAGCSMQALVYFVMLRIYPADIYTEMEMSLIRLCSQTGNFLCQSTFFQLVWLFSFTDIDECEEISDVCPSNSRCVNHDGSYECVCNDECLRKFATLLCMICTNLAWYIVRDCLFDGIACLLLNHAKFHIHVVIV